MFQYVFFPPEGKHERLPSLLIHVSFMISSSVCENTHDDFPNVKSWKPTNPPSKYIQFTNVEKNREK